MFLVFASRRFFEYGRSGEIHENRCFCEKGDNCPGTDPTWYPRQNDKLDSYRIYEPMVDNSSMSKSNSNYMNTAFVLRTDCQVSQELMGKWVIFFIPDTQPGTFWSNFVLLVGYVV